MIRIVCVNPESFELKGKSGCVESMEGENGAISFIVKCSFCKTDNMVWLKRSKEAKKSTNFKIMMSNKPRKYSDTTKWGVYD